MVPDTAIMIVNFIKADGISSLFYKTRVATQRKSTVQEKQEGGPGLHKTNTLGVGISPHISAILEKRIVSFSHIMQEPLLQ
jgi:hypothetical protein